MVVIQKGVTQLEPEVESAEPTKSCTHAKSHDRWALAAVESSYILTVTDVL